MVKPYSNLIMFSSPFKISTTRSLPVSRSEVCTFLKLIPNLVKETSTLMITELLLKFLVVFGLLRVVLEQIYKPIGICRSLEFINVNDLVRTEVDGTEILGFVEIREWFGVTIKMENGVQVFISNEILNEKIITKYPHRMKNGRVNLKFATQLEINMNHYDEIREEIYKILEEDKDLEQEDPFAAINSIDSVNWTAVVQDYFQIIVPLKCKLHPRLHTTVSSVMLPIYM
ncbi:hypothetical protein MKW92_037404 [Papaver armeniacum]|nr:hypothetical protein MKW92_037404 [Papaver armeniacum]